MAAFFSEDIFIEILKRLPVRSLIRFRLVQKSRYHLIQSRYFNTLFSRHHENTYILFRSRRFISLHHHDKQFNQYSSPPLPKDIEWDGYGFCKISNGLICFSDFELQQIYLWNPVIRKYKTLPQSPILSDDPLRRHPIKSFAFGYVPKIDDYKVIKIEKYCDDWGEPVPNFVRCYVYSLSTNSWKTVCTDNCSEFNFLDKNSLVINGALYWIVTSDRLIKVIACFDIESEIIREIMLPPQLEDVHVFYVAIVRKTSDLSLFHLDHGYTLNIWILENKGEIKDVWTKKLTLDLSRLGDIRCWWSEDFRNDDEIILMKHSGSRCGYISYDIKKDEPTAIIDDLPNLLSAPDVKPGELFITASPFVENLVLLGEN